MDSRTGMRGAARSLCGDVKDDLGEKKKLRRK